MHDEDPQFEVCGGEARHGFHIVPSGCRCLGRRSLCGFEGLDGHSQCEQLFFEDRCVHMVFLVPLLFFFVYFIGLFFSVPDLVLIG